MKASIMAALAVMGALFMSLLQGACTHNVYYTYKITVEVDTPEGVKSGSSVILVGGSTMREWVPDPSGGTFNWGVRGEAVTVDLGSRGLLFALLCGRDTKGRPTPDHAAYVARTAFLRAGKLAPVVGRFEEVKQGRTLAGLRDSVDLIPSEFPYLVRFKDIADPKTVEAVDPANLGASFGDGVRLKRVNVTITDAPATTGIEKTLGWLNHLERYRTNPANVFSNTLDQTISYLRSGNR